MSAVERLRELERETTPAPWRRRDHNIEGEEGRRRIAYTTEPFSERQAVGDADLIVDMRNALPALLDIAEAAEVVSDPMVADGGGDRWWSALDVLRDVVARLDKLP